MWGISLALLGLCCAGGAVFGILALLEDDVEFDDVSQTWLAKQNEGQCRPRNRG